MQKIVEASNWVSQKLAGPYEYKENHYQNLLKYALQKRGLIISTEENLTYTIKDGKNSVVIGYGRLDLKVISPAGEVFILELKVAETLKYLKSYKAQLRRYLQHYAARGILVVFSSGGNPLVLHVSKD